MDRFAVYKLLQFDLYDYFNLVTMLLCNRCSHHHYQNLVVSQEEKTWCENAVKSYPFAALGKSPDVPADFGLQYFHAHHDFHLHKYIFSQKLTEKNVEDWFSDSEHGYFHGLMTGFIAYFLMKYVYQNRKYLPHLIKTKKHFSKKTDSRVYFEGKIKVLSELFFSCIFHDYARVAEGSENHDKKLKEYFPYFLEETYTHQNPPKDGLLVSSDRIELRRYKDYEEWKDEKIVEQYSSKFTSGQGLYLDIFYSTVRPALLYFFEKRKELFVRHGPEYRMQGKQGEKYPTKNFAHLAKDFGGNEFRENYAVEIDEFPLKFCSNHSGEAIWQFIKGYISLDELRDAKFGYWVREEKENFDSIHFDHLVMKAERKIEDWVFLHRPVVIGEISTPTLEPNETHEAMSHKIMTPEDWEKEIKCLFDLGAKVALQSLVGLLGNNLFNFRKYLELFTRLKVSEI